MRVMERAGIWYVAFDAGGRHRRLSLGLKAEDVDRGTAVLRAAEFVARWCREHGVSSGAPAADSGVTLWQLVERWAASQGHRCTANLKQDISRARRMAEFLGPQRRASSLTARDVTRYLDHRASKLSGASMIRERAAVLIVVKWGWMAGLIPEDFRARIPRARDDSVPHDPTPRHIVASILAATENDRVLGIAYHLAAYAGFSVQDIVRARWSDIDWMDRTITPRGTKTPARGRPIPLHPHLEEYLLRWKEEAEGYARTNELSDLGAIVWREWGVRFGFVRTGMTEQALGNRRRRFVRDNPTMTVPQIHRVRAAYGDAILRTSKSYEATAALMRHDSADVTRRRYAPFQPVYAREELHRIDMKSFEV